MSSAATLEIKKTATLLSKAQNLYNLIIPYLKPENVVVAGIIGSGVASLAWCLSKIIAYLQKKIARLVFTTSTINSATNPLGYEQMTGLLKSLCRDDHGLVTIKGDDGNKQESAADEILTHDTNETLLRLRSGMPPVAVRFVPGVFSASFFFVASKNETERKNFFKHIVYVWRDGDPSLFIQLVPDSLRSAISWAWQNAGPETVLIKIFGSENYQKMTSALIGGEGMKVSKATTPSLHVTTLSSMQYLHAYFQDEASSFHQMRMTKSLIVNDLMKGMKVQGSPRPMVCFVLLFCCFCHFSSSSRKVLFEQDSHTFSCLSDFLTFFSASSFFLLPSSFLLPPSSFLLLPSLMFSSPFFFPLLLHTVYHCS